MRRPSALQEAWQGPERIPPSGKGQNDLLLPSPLQETKQEEEERLVLESNPLEWTVTDVVRFIKLTDCAPLAKIFQEQVQWFCSQPPDRLAQLASWVLAVAGEGVPGHRGGPGGEEDLDSRRGRHGHPLGGSLLSSRDGSSGLYRASAHTPSTGWWQRGQGVSHSLARLELRAPPLALTGLSGVALCPAVEQSVLEGFYLPSYPSSREQASVGPLFLHDNGISGLPMCLAIKIIDWQTDKAKELASTL